MIARGAMGDPFIFRAARAAMEGRRPEPIAPSERVDAARRHLALAARFLGERTACVEFRKQFCSYTHGTEGGAGLRAAGVKACTIGEFELLFGRWLSASPA
jgi:tRNA-dihydrouridine synthase B